MGQKQRKEAEIKGTPPVAPVQSDTSHAPQGTVAEAKVSAPSTEQGAEHRTAGALRMEPHEREEQILQVASEHFARKGVLGASMSAIARDAGITRALLYHYFPGKDSLAAAVTRREAKAVLEALGEHNENPEEALRNALRTYFLVVAGVPTPGGEDFPNNPPDYLEWMLTRTGMPINDRTRVILGGWLQLVDYFALHVVQLNPRDQRTVRTRGLGLEEAIDLCLGAVDTSPMFGCRIRRQWGRGSPDGYSSAGPRARAGGPRYRATAHRLEDPESAVDSRNTIRFVSRERRAPRTSLMGRRGALCRARKAPRRCLVASGSRPKPVRASRR